MFTHEDTCIGISEQSISSSVFFSMQMYCTVHIVMLDNVWDTGKLLLREWWMVPLKSSQYIFIPNVKMIITKCIYIMRCMCRITARWNFVLIFWIWIMLNMTHCRSFHLSLYFTSHTCCVLVTPSPPSIHIAYIVLLWIYLVSQRQK